MENNLIVSISGLRGVFGESLTPEVILKYSTGFAKYVKAKKIIIGRDGRNTGEIVSNLVSSTLLYSGIEVIDIGVAPTPTVQLGVEYFKGGGGISISASHNPIQWNGLKFLSNTGMFLNHTEHAEFCNLVKDDSKDYKTWEKIGKYSFIPEFADIHIQKILNLPLLNIENIKKRKFKVAIDCVNASGSKIIPALLKEFGCEVIPIYCDLTGFFPHIPEPLPQNLSDLSQKVVETKADLGIAVDPDADRLVLICDDGSPFGEEYTITQSIRFILGKKKGKAVINISTTRAVDDIVKEYGCELIKTPVGEINVAEKMKETGALIGGEGSGGVILPEVHYGRDSLAGIAIILQSMVESKISLSQMKKTLPYYYMDKAKIILDSMNEAEHILKSVEKNHKNENLIAMDGIRIDYQDSWIIIRKSNTEPIIRIYTESITKENAKNLSDKFINEIETLRIGKNI